MRAIPVQGDRQVDQLARWTCEVRVMRSRANLPVEQGAQQQSRKAEDFHLKLSNGNSSL